VGSLVRTQLGDQGLEEFDVGLLQLRGWGPGRQRPQPSTRQVCEQVMFHNADFREAVLAAL